MAVDQPGPDQSAPAKSSAGEQELMDTTLRNQTDSPLLRLPAELRNKIYRYAIGGHIILVRDAGGDTNPGLKLCPATHSSFLRSSNACDKFWQIYGCDCIMSIFQLSLVCRQLAAETRLLFYPNNTFVFHDLKASCMFASKLFLEQRTAIADIGIDSLEKKGWWLYESPDKWNNLAREFRHSDGVKPSIRDVFPGVERLYVRPWDHLHGGCLPGARRNADLEDAVRILNIGGPRDGRLKLLLVDLLNDSDVVRLRNKEVKEMEFKDEKDGVQGYVTSIGTRMGRGLEGFW